MATKPKAPAATSADQPAAEQATPDVAPVEPAAPRPAAKPRTFDKAVAALKQDADAATAAVTADPGPSASVTVAPAAHAMPAPAARHVVALVAATKPLPAAPQAPAPTPPHITQGVSRVMKTAEQLAQFHQGNMEAIVKSGQIWATGLQDLSKHVASNAQATMEETISTFRAMTSVKSLKEAFELQSSFARASMEKAMSESSKLTESGLKLAEQAYAPITARVNAAVEVFTNRG